MLRHLTRFSCWVCGVRGTARGRRAHACLAEVRYAKGSVALHGCSLTTGRSRRNGWPNLTSPTAVVAAFLSRGAAARPVLSCGTRAQAGDRTECTLEIAVDADLEQHGRGVRRSPDRHWCRTLKSQRNRCCLKAQIADPRRSQSPLARVAALRSSQPRGWMWRPSSRREDAGHRSVLAPRIKVAVRLQPSACAAA